MEIIYTFILEDDISKIFKLDIDDKSLTFIEEEKRKFPKWCRLDFHQCAHCQIDEEFCPVATNLEQSVSFFSNLISHAEAKIFVEQNNRTIFSYTTIQNGLQSLMGLLIATSRCPHTDFLKPMARFHLPFADCLETMWRSSASFLLGEFLNGTKELSFDSLKKEYEQIEILNRYMAARLVAASQKDSNVNALIKLDMFAKKIIPALEKKMPKLMKIYETT